MQPHTVHVPSYWTSFVFHGVFKCISGLVKSFIIPKFIPTKHKSAILNDRGSGSMKIYTFFVSQEGVACMCVLGFPGCLCQCIPGALFTGHDGCCKVIQSFRSLIGVPMKFWFTGCSCHSLILSYIPSYYI